MYIAEFSQIRTKGLIQMTKRISRRLLSAVLTLAIALTCIITPQLSVTTEAKTSKNAIELAQFGLQAYRAGWQYSYGAWGQKAGSTRISDCSGLIYAYLCWSYTQAKANANYEPSANYSWPRGAQSQYDACSQTGDISTLPRTHGILLFFPNCDHVGIYVGNGYAVDNSDYGTNMVYKKVQGRGWVSWGKLGCINYPTNGWYKFNGKYYYYQNGQYVINKTLKIDGVSYKFNSAGVSSPQPSSSTTNGSGTLQEDSSTKDNCSITMYSTDPVNVRSGPSTSYSSYGVIAAGTNVTVTNKSNSSWYKVKLTNGTVGYIYSEYLTAKSSSSSTSSSTKATATPTPTATPKATTSTVSISAKTTADVWLRSGTSTSSTGLKVVKTGTSVTITNKSNSSWYKVKLSDGTQGYIFSQYLSETKISPYSAKIKVQCVLRKSASSTSAAVKTLAANTKITVTKRSTSGKWYYITTSAGTKGWVPWNYTTKMTTITGKTTAKINLRKSASTSSTSLKTVSSGTSVVISSTSTGGWLRVVLSDGTQGWMVSKYITTSVSAKTTADLLRIRSGPSLSSSVKTTVPEGTKVTITNYYDKSWYKVKLANGTVGYASTDYVKAT
jgi:uncharacterized protein YgiM (DUF1202 family)